MLAQRSRLKISHNFRYGGLSAHGNFVLVLDTHLQLLSGFFVVFPRDLGAQQFGRGVDVSRPEMGRAQIGLALNRLMGPLEEFGCSSPEFLLGGGEVFLLLGRGRSGIRYTFQVLDFRGRLEPLLHVGQMMVNYF